MRRIIVSPILILSIPFAVVILLWKVADGFAEVVLEKLNAWLKNRI